MPRDVASMVEGLRELDCCERYGFALLTGRTRAICSGLSFVAAQTAARSFDARAPRPSHARRSEPSAAFVSGKSDHFEFVMARFAKGAQRINESFGERLSEIVKCFVLPRICIKDRP